MYKFITNFNYIYFFRIFYIETKQEKIIFLNYFLFFIVFFGTKSSLKILHIKNNNKLYNNDNKNISLSNKFFSHGCNSYFDF